MVLSLTCDSVHLIAAYYSFYLPQKDERLSWLRTYSKQFTHISGHPSAVGQAQIRESSLVNDRRSTTVPRSQLQNPNGQTNWCKKTRFTLFTLTNFAAEKYVDKLVGVTRCEVEVIISKRQATETFTLLSAAKLPPSCWISRWRKTQN